MRNNRGVIITGGTQAIDQMVVGDHASGHLTKSIAQDGGGDRQLLLDRLDQLAALLQQRAAELPEGEYLLGDARRIASEVKKPEPDKGKVASLLDVLESGTKGVASAATLVTAVRALATAVLGFG